MDETAQTTGANGGPDAAPRERLQELRQLWTCCAGVDLDVNRGEVVCVIGPSGSGKSTLLRCINLLEPPERGRIYLEGKEITRQERPTKGIDFVRRASGMVFQQFNLFPHKSAIENVAHGAGEGAGPLAGRGNGRRPRRCSSASGMADEGRRVPRPPLGRPAAARGDRPGAGDGPARDALRRGHERARPRARQGGPRRDARAGRRGDDDGRRHPRDAVRPGRRPQGRLHGRRRGRRGRARPRTSSATPSRSAPRSSWAWC